MYCHEIPAMDSRTESRSSPNVPANHIRDRFLGASVDAPPTLVATVYNLVPVGLTAAGWRIILREWT